MRRSHPLTTLFAGLAMALSTVGSVTGIEGLDTPASDLRISLDRLLSEHAFLTVQALEASVTDDEQFAAAADALEANTAELEDAFEGIYDREAGRRFGDLWRTHIGYVVDFTRARQAGDVAAERRATAGLDAYQNEFVSFLAGANPHLSEETLHHMLEDHIGQLQQVANIEAGDYDTVYAVAREAYAHMFELGDGLSRAIARQFPDRFSGSTIAFGPAFDMQVSLDRLLGEHAFFAVEVMRLADSTPDHQRAASDALASNGQSLSATISDIYGAEAGRGFAAIWEQHNGHYVDYVRARLAGDEPAADVARDGLEEFSGQVSDFFVAANDLLDAEAVRAGVAAHTDHLLEQVDAHGADDHVVSFAIGREAHRHMGAVSNLLATGIANQFPARFLPDTSLPSVGAISAVGWLALTAATVIGLHRTWKGRRSGAGSPGSG